VLCLDELVILRRDLYPNSPPELLSDSKQKMKKLENENYREEYRVEVEVLLTLRIPLPTSRKTGELHR
jgi:hypothetical protein